jgi:pyruvate formate lyase activating enzyme
VAQCYAEALQLAGSAMSADEVVARVIKDRDFFLQSGGGVTFSGGEPLSRPAFLRACLEKCKQNGLHTCVETTGFAPWEVLEGVSEDVDLFLYDLKTADPKTHEIFTGVSNELILDNLKKLAPRHNLIIRMPMIPGINHRGAPWKKTLEFLKELEWRGQVELLPYHRLGLGKYAALNRPYPMDPELKADEMMIQMRYDELRTAGIHVI